MFGVARSQKNGKKGREKYRQKGDFLEQLYVGPDFRIFVNTALGY